MRAGMTTILSPTGHQMASRGLSTSPGRRPAPIEIRPMPIAACPTSLMALSAGP